MPRAYRVTGLDSEQRVWLAALFEYCAKQVERRNWLLSSAGTVPVVLVFVLAQVPSSGLVVGRSCLPADSPLPPLNYLIILKK